MVCWGIDLKSYKTPQTNFQFYDHTELIESISGGAKDLAIGAQHDCMINFAGRVFCWGRNTSGETGQASENYTADASKVEGLDDVKAAAEGRAIDVVFDPVGGDLSIRATRAIAWGGRFLIVGFASGSIAAFPANHALIKGYSLIGLRAGEAGRRDPALAARNRDVLAELAEQGVMRPHISHRFPLDQTADALRALQNRNVIGRAVIVMP